MANKHGLTDEERDEIAGMSTEDIRILVEGNIRKKYKIEENKKTYAKSCTDFIRHLEARTKHAIKVLGDHAIAAGDAVPGEEAEPGAEKSNVTQLPAPKGKKAPGKKPAAKPKLAATA